MVAGPTGGVGNLLQGLGKYFSDSADALSRIPGGLSRLAENFTDRPLDTIASVANSFPQTRVQGQMLSGSAAIFGSLAANAARGLAFERSVIQALNIAKNTTKIEVEGIGRSIPDILLRGVSEIKSGIEISNSVQLRTQAAHAMLMGVPFNPIVSPATQRISQSVQQLVGSTGGTIQRFNPATGVFAPFP